MPGHTSKKQSQRTKGNARPSSSSQAAQLLASAGTAPTGFIGFGSPGYVPASQAFDDVDSSLDSDFRMVLRKLTKKDSTTKIKALQEFHSLCEDKDVELVKAILPYWPRIYNRVAIDVDHKVRETTQQAMNALVQRVRKNLAPHLKSVMGSWLLCQCDTYPTVALAAYQAFQTAFPPAKQTDALVFCKSVIVEYLVDNLLNQTPATLSDSLTTEKEDMICKYNRVLTSSLLALRKLLTSIPANEIEDIKEALKNLLKDGKFWKHGKSTIVSIRSAMYTFLAGLCQTLPDLAEEFSKKLAPFILNNIDERDPVICPAVWEAVLSLTNYHMGCWADVSIEKSVWPKLRNMLENGCYGNSVLIAPDLLPFISKVPPDLLKHKYKIYIEFLNHMKLGLSKDTVQSNSSECSAFIKAYIECTHFVLKEVDDEAVVKIILQDQLLPVVLSSVLESDSTLSQTPLYSMVGYTLEKLENSDRSNDTVYSFWSEMADKIKERLCQDVNDITMVTADRVILLAKNIIYPQFPVRTKSEKQKIQLDTGMQDSKDVDNNKLTKGTRSFIQNLTLCAFENAHKQWNPPCLHLFSALVEMEPADDSIKRVIECCHGDIDTDQSHSNYFVFNVCLPWLQHVEDENNIGDQKQIISVICTFMSMLDNDSLQALLQTLTETIKNFESFYHLLTKCIQLESSFSCIRTWLQSDVLGNKLVSIATDVCSTSAKSLDGETNQFGWDLLSLVLSAGQLSEQIIKEEYIKQILQIIHNTLLSLGVNTDSNRADVAVRFVAKATYSFFVSSRLCLLLPSAEDLLITLFSISLDDTFKVSDETMKECEMVWTSGISSVVKQTGGLIKDGGLLEKAVEVVKEKLLLVQNQDMFDRINSAINKLLSVVKESLPDNKGSNPVLKDLITRLYMKTDNTVPSQVLHYHMLKGDITYLTLKLDTEMNRGFAQILYSGLFDVQLLSFEKITFPEQETSGVELDPEDSKLLLGVYHSMITVQLWEQCKGDIKHQTFTKSIESLESVMTVLIHELTDDCKKKLLSVALDSACEHGMLWSCVLQTVLHKFTDDVNFTLDFNSLLDRCSELTESGVQVLQVAAQYLTSENRHTLAEIMVARIMSERPLNSVNGGIQALAVFNTAIKGTDDLENANGLVKTALSQILTWKEEHEDLFLYASNIEESKPEVVLSNVETMKFLQQTVSLIPTLMTDKDWDFIMCSLVSFVQSIEESTDKLDNSVVVQMFTCEVCRLLSKVIKCILTDDETVKSSFPPNLITEWNEFFSEGIYGVLLPLFVKISGKQGLSMTGQVCLLLQSLSLVVCQCPKQQILEHKLPPYLKTDDTSDLSDSLQTLLNHVCPLLSHNSREVQLAAYHILYSIIPELPQYEKDSKETEEEEVARYPPQQFMVVLQSCSNLEDVLSGLHEEECLKIYPQTKEYTEAMSYLLTWRLLLYFFKSSCQEIRQEYSVYFRQTGLIYQLLHNIYCLMPDNPTQDTKAMFDQNFMISVTDEKTYKNIQYLACNVYRHTLQTVPAMVRQWWREQDRKTMNYVDKFTSKHVSQILCTEEIQPVNKSDTQLDNITIKTRPLAREVLATYALEEVTIEMVIALPENYPLGTISVISEKRVGVTALTWEKWLLQLNVFLQYQNGSIVDGLRIWKKNIDKRFEGVDDCMICFSVIHGTNYQLPRLTCKTCKKKFHSACLYKWFQTSHNSTCPLCRNLF